MKDHRVIIIRTTTGKLASVGTYPSKFKEAGKSRQQYVEEETERIQRGIRSIPSDKLREALSAVWDSTYPPKQAKQKPSEGDQPEQAESENK